MAMEWAMETAMEMVKELGMVLALEMAMVPVTATGLVMDMVLGTATERA